MRPLALPLFAVLLSASAAEATELRYSAPIGHRQPSVDDVARARAAHPGPSFDLNEEARRLEGNLKQRLIICRC